MAAGPVLAALSGLAALGAQAPAVSSLEADSPRRGHIRLTVAAPPGTEVELREGRRVLGRVTTDAAAEAELPDAARWRCAPLRRRFTAWSGGRPLAAPVVLSTPSCRRRLALALPARRLRAGTPLRVRVTDTWGLGATGGRVCARRRAGRGTGRCRRVTLPAGRTRATLTFRPFHRGPWRVRVRTRYGLGAVRGFAVRRIRHLRVLAAGDSMIQIVDGLVRARLAPRGARVRTDDHTSSGLTVPFGLDWPRRARATARGWRPDVAVVFLGANDGFALGRAACCGRSWVRAYAARVRGMMRDYARGGAARVYWLTLPAPRDGSFRRVFAGVNRALRRAVRRVSNARLVDLAAVVSPGFRFRPGVRQADGVHLNVRGAGIAARLVVRALLRDGLI